MHLEVSQALGSNVNRRERGYNRDQHEALDFYKEVSPDTQPPSPIPCCSLVAVSCQVKSHILFV
jgi:hypothetical protein